MASSPITTITATLHLSSPTAGTTYATVSDFQLTSGTVTDGVWQSSTAVQLPPGTSAIDLAVDDTAKDHVVLPSAGQISNRVQPHFKGQPAHDAVLPAEGVQALKPYQGGQLGTGHPVPRAREGRAKRDLAGVVRG